MKIPDEIKVLHSKKQQMNHQIYRLHPFLADTWNSTWHYMLPKSKANSKGRPRINTRT